MEYRNVLVELTNELAGILEKRRLEIKSDNDSERIAGLKLIIQIKSLIDIQEKLINHVAILEGKSISEVRDEFGFAYF